VRKFGNCMPLNGHVCLLKKDENMVKEKEKGNAKLRIVPIQKSLEFYELSKYYKSYSKWRE
jgi:hypothetical protein